jgi:hypothetical protein
MREQNNTQNGTKAKKIEQASPVVGPSSSSVSAGYLQAEVHTSHVSYNEMADVTVQYVDPIAEVQKNLAHLQELQDRMKFMMREVRYLLKI